MKPVKNLPSATVVAAPFGVPRAGQLIGDRYRLDRPLERGAMGSVWRAEQVRLRAPVAVKFLDPSLIGDREMHDRFIQEARSAAAVRSAHVVQVFDYGSDGGVPYIAMELLDGENLDARLGSRGTLTPAELDRLFTELARGISQAHAIGVIHRDLKPGNIFIAREGEHEVTKIVDFGIAKVKAGALHLTQGIGTQLGTLLGTPQYMSPEQVRGSGSIDHRTDLWALAVIACECLTGRCPFSGATIGDLTVQICTERPPAPSSLGPVPRGFDQWFFKATQKKPNKRFQKVEEMAAQLHAVLASAVLAESGAGRGGRLITLPSRSEVRLAYSAVVTWKGYMVARLGNTWVGLRQLMQQAVARLVVEWELARQRVHDLVNSQRFAFLRPLAERHGMLASVVLLCCGILLLGLTTRGADSSWTAQPEAAPSQVGQTQAAVAQGGIGGVVPRADGMKAELDRSTTTERNALLPARDEQAAAAAANTAVANTAVANTAGANTAVATTASAKTAGANTAVAPLPAALTQPVAPALQDGPQASTTRAADVTAASPKAQKSEQRSESPVRITPPPSPAKATVAPAAAQPVAAKPKAITKAMAQAAAKILTADDLVASVPPAAKKPVQRNAAPRARADRPSNVKSASHPFDDRL